MSDGTTWSDGLDDLLRAAHARLSRDPTARSFRVRLGEPAREALADLLGLASRPAPQTHVRLDRLDQAVSQATGLPLRAYLEERFGPLTDPAAPRRQAAADRESLWRWWLAHPWLRDRPALTAWAQDVARRGTHGGVAATRRRLEQVLAVLDALPAADEPLPVLAGRLLNDTHALDGNRRLASYVLDAVAAQRGRERPTDAAGRRALWRCVGVRDDELSSVVVVAGLRPEGTTTVAQVCRAAAEAGEAAALTLAQVRQPVLTWGVGATAPFDALDRSAPPSGPVGRPPPSVGRTVHIVENAAVVALAVAELGTATPPLVCAAGWPNTAVTTLLGHLTQAGATLRYHGDLDGEGVRIAAHLADLVGARPWRMSTTDYLRDVAPTGAPVGRVTDAPWDPGLAPAMRQHGVAVLEETVWHHLRADLLAETHGSALLPHPFVQVRL